MRISKTSEELLRLGSMLVVYHYCILITIITTILTAIISSLLIALYALERESEQCQGCY